MSMPEQMLPVVTLAMYVRDPIKAEYISRSWNMSNDERRELVFVCENVDETLSLGEIKRRVATGVFSEQNAVNILAAQDRWDDYRELRAWKVPPFPLSGNDVMRALNLSPGVAVGVALNTAREQWARSDFRLSAQSLLEILE